MAPSYYQASAPGSLMLFGEHAVLHGKTALVSAIDKRIKARLIPRKDDKIIIDAKAFGKHETTIQEIKITPTFQFILSVIQLYLPQIKNGFELTINSDFSEQLGLGSSAAVTTVTIALLNSWLNQKILEKEKIHDLALKVIRSIQGQASGADIAASIYGGILQYQIDPQKMTPYKQQFPLTVVYSGEKASTTDVVAAVEKQRKQQPELFNTIFNAIGETSKVAAQCIKEKNWVKLGETMIIAQKFMTDIGVNTIKLQSIIENLCKQPNIYGAKISGAGLGDCVVAVGELNNNVFSNQLKIEITQKGLIYDKS